MTGRTLNIMRFQKEGCPVVELDNGTNHPDLLKSIKISDKQENIYQIQLPLPVNLNIYQDILSENHIQILLSAINIIKDKFAINHLVSIVHQPFWFPLVQKINRNKTHYSS